MPESAPGRGVSGPGGCLLCSGGCLLPWGVSASVGGVLCLLRGVSALGGVCSRGLSAPGGRCLLPGGVCSWGAITACIEADTLPCEQNDKQVQKYYLGHNFVAAVLMDRNYYMLVG